MSNYILDSNLLGNTFDSVASKAKSIAVKKQVIVEFDFNGIKCLVSKDTDLKLLWRDYSNAFLMDWKEVGYLCVAEYDKKTKSEYNKRKKASDEKQRLADIEYKLKDAAKKQIFDKKVEGIEIELKDVDGWHKFKEMNSKDGYSRCVVEYAEGWARLMQSEMAHGKTLEDCASKTSFELGFLGITGFMYGCAVSSLASFWKYGEELRKWHNKEYNHEGDGVVNPAILTIETA